MSAHPPLVSVVIVALLTLGTPAEGRAQESDVFALLGAVDEAATRHAWPGFHLSDWPIAVFDGTRTLLLRHPNPPPEFAPLPGRPGILMCPGHHPAVRGNSTADIGGVRTATVIAIGGPTREGTLLAYVEELFHVFWLHRHVNFRPNEIARYAYPVKDLRNLRWMRFEDEALARALEADNPPQAAAWAAAALEARRQRNVALSADDRAFETGLEMMEGTANYVARVAVGLKAAETARRLRARRSADQIRWRFYDSGAAICLLLDQLQPDWKARIDSQPELTTIALLSAGVRRAGARRAAFASAEMVQFGIEAAAAIAELSARQARIREEVGNRNGSRVVVEIASGAQPLRVTRFDPINLLVLDAGEVVHPRYITLSGANGIVEASNPAYARGSFGGIVALTRPAGRHPLADGIRSLTLVGLRSAPKVDRQDSRLLVEADGIRIALQNADVRIDGETLHITVGSARK